MKYLSISLIIFLYYIPFELVAGSFTMPDSTLKSYTATRVVGRPPVIDGKFDDDAWKAANWEGQFKQHEPYNDTLPTQETSFMILYDDKNLYVAIRAWDTETEKIVTRLSRRDEYEGDMVAIQIDSYNDDLTAFSFILSAAGVQIDDMITEDGDIEDFSWDAVWYSKTSKDDKGWSAEICIPLTQIRFGKEDHQTWGLQVLRYIHRKDELSTWQNIQLDSPGWVHMFGQMNGISGLKPRNQIELMPYGVARYETHQKQEGNPYKPGEKTSLDAGLDAKIGITNDMTLDLTVNPDFGQVEADPSVVNLSGFETYYEEKRPFFIEGRNILSFGLTPGDNSSSADNLFYTRRIGRRPHIYPQGNQYVDMPDNSTILGAFKITGKTKNGLSLGILESITAKESARVQNNGSESLTEVEPFTNYLVSRIQKDFSQGTTRIGGMFTSTNRNLTTSESKKLHQSAYTGGFDFNTSWKNKVYYLNTKFLFSQVNGDKEAIRRTQESSVHYYQQPDATYKKYDTTRTSLSGHGGIIQFGKGGDGHWRFTTWLNWRSPGLDLNDVGFLRSANDIFQVIWVAYRWWEPFSIFRDAQINANQWSGWDFGGNNTYKGVNINFNGQLKNYWNFGGGFNRDFEGLSNNLLRGGPAMRFPGYINYWGGVSTDERKKLLFGIETAFQKGDFNYDNEQNFEIGVTYKPTDALNMKISPGLSFKQNQIQYITRVQNLTEPRYILGTIDQRVFSLSLRLNYCISPNFTIQYYGQPFIASGKYSDIKRVTESRDQNYTKRFHVFNSSELTYDDTQSKYFVDEDLNGTSDYSFNNPNFNSFDFISNLVIRWEYMPGSTVYLVWSQNRSGSEKSGIFHFEDNMNALFNVYPQDVFLVKLSYRIMR